MFPLWRSPWLQSYVYGANRMNGREDHIHKVLYDGEGDNLGFLMENLFECPSMNEFV